MSAPDTIEAEVVEPGAEVVPVESANLFRTSEPSEVLERAMSTANALMPVVREKGLIANIQGKDHLTVEAWQTLGAMLGVTPVCLWTRKLDNGWEARVEARTLEGRVIGAAEAECLTAETRWAKADDFAIRSMAQTRATSKALASVLRFVATLGGAAGTPAEEMHGVTQESRSKGFASDKQEKFFRGLLSKAGAKQDTMDMICAYASAELEGGREGQISKAIDAMKDGDAREVGKQLAEEAFAWSAKQSDVPADESGLEEVEGDPFAYEGDQ